MRNIQTVLQNTMKDHIYENLDPNEYFEKVENETKTFLQYANIEPKKYCIIQVDNCDEILHKT